MIKQLTSPEYVNRVRQDWTANGGVYGDSGISASNPGNNPFSQLGPTLDLVFAGVPTDPLNTNTLTDYTINLYFTPQTYQIAAQYTIWE